MNKKNKSVAVMCFSGNNGGMELDAIKLAELLHEDCDVTLFCKKDSFIHHQLKKKTLIEFVPVGFISRTFSLSMLISVRNEIKNRKINNIVFFGASELKTLYFSFLGLPLNVMVRHGTTKSHKKNGIIHRLVYSCVNYHISLSKHLLENVKIIVPQASESAYKIIYPSYKIKSSVRISKTVVHKDLQITHVGRVAVGKGQIDAVRACGKLQEKGLGFQLDLLGGAEGNAYAALQKEINSIDFVSRVHLRGHVTNVTEYLEATDVFLFPSSGEGMPNAFIEAMYQGAVCIAYENTVFPEFLEMGFYIHLVKNSEIEELSKKLIQVALDIENEKLKSEKNIGLVQGYFRVEEELAQWLKILV